MRLATLTVATIALFVLGPSTAPAAVIYEELTNLDDLPLDPPYPLLLLNPGTNSVIGRTSISADAADNFAFSVPDGFSLTSITYSFTTSAFIRGEVSLTEAMSGFLLVSGDGTGPLPESLLAAQNVDMVPGLCSPFIMPCGPSSPSAVIVALFTSALPRGPGIYALEQRALTVNDPEFVSWNSSYRIDLVVVPEAGTSLLLLSGVAALAGLGRGRP